MPGGDEEDRQPEMPMGFSEPQAPFLSGSQSARHWSESWVRDWGFCIQCGHSRLLKFDNNEPVADFRCESCSEQFELKSKRGRLGAKVADGAYRTKIDRLTSSQNPNLLLMTYDLTERAVTNLIAVPKHYFVPRIIQKRRPLAPSARRAGWIGSNILLSEIPDSGKIYIVRDSLPQPRGEVMKRWQTNSFLANAPLDARGWLLEIMRTVEALGKPEFEIADVYADEARLSTVYPGNRHVREKIRQQLQVLRDYGYLDFVSRGIYKLRRS
ncbi:MAG: DpnI domain-containing protein [Hyphomicrobiaceae bacterium]